MRTKLFTAFILLAILFAAVLPGTALAGAYETSFITSITYQNVDTTATTNLRVYFYESPSDTTPVEIIRPNLNAGASTSLFIGGLTEITAGFRGTAVLASDKKMVATLVQLPQNSTTVKNRPLSNGFSNGTATTLLATIIKGTHNTVFSVQNAGTSATDVTITIYNTSASPVHTINTNLQPGAGYFVDAGTITQLGASFTGSAVIQSTGGSIVSSAMELQTGTGLGAYAFEGLGSGATPFYMPSALCNYNNGIVGTETNTYYAVQNTSLSQSTTATVTYSNGATESKLIGAGAKASFTTCQASGMTQNFLGSATIGSSSTPIIAVGKVLGNGLTTAFVGFPAGSANIALPYVRWATIANYNSGAQQRVYIAIQNVGSSTITGNILVRYIDRDGTIVATHTITQDVLAGGKVNSNASSAGLTEFGVYNNGTQFGGGVLIEGPAGSSLAAIARVQSFVPTSGLNAGEDYNGSALP